VGQTGKLAKGKKQRLNIGDDLEPTANFDLYRNIAQHGRAVPSPD
jgi:hypothetical protein